MWEEAESVLSEKLAVLQSQLEVSLHAAPHLGELANIQTSLQAISEKMQSLLTSFQNVEASRKQDLEILRAEMEGQISKDLEAAKKSWSEENLLEIDNKLGEQGNSPKSLHHLVEPQWAPKHYTVSPSCSSEREDGGGKWKDNSEKAHGLRCRQFNRQGKTYAASTRNVKYGNHSLLLIGGQMFCHHKGSRAPSQIFPEETNAITMNASPSSTTLMRE